MPGLDKLLVASGVGQINQTLNRDAMFNLPQMIAPFASASQIYIGDSKEDGGGEGRGGFASILSYCTCGDGGEQVPRCSPKSGICEEGHEVLIIVQFVKKCPSKRPANFDESDY